MRLYSVDLEPVHKESSSMTVNFRTHSILFTDSSLCGSSSLSSATKCQTNEIPKTTKTKVKNSVRKLNSKVIMSTLYCNKTETKMSQIEQCYTELKSGHYKGYTTIRLLYYVRTCNPHILLYATRLYILGEPYVRTHSYG